MPCICGSSAAARISTGSVHQVADQSHQWPTRENPKYQKCYIGASVQAVVIIRTRWYAEGCLGWAIDHARRLPAVLGSCVGLLIALRQLGAVQVQPCNMAAAALLLLLAVGGGVPTVVAGDRRVEKLPSGGVMEVETFVGTPKWRLLPHLFSERTVNVTCPGMTVSPQHMGC